MDFKPSPERQILFDTLKKYFENEYSLSDRNIAAHSDLGYSKKAWEAMRDLGILESLIDPELDGFGGTALDISTVFEALGRGLVVEPFLEVGILAAKVLSRGNDAQKSLVKKILENECLPILAHSETDTESSKSFVETPLSVEADGSYKISGAKRMIKHACRVSDLTFTNVSISSEELGGELGMSYSIVSDAIDTGILAICSEALGIMERIKELTLEYLKTRKQFGVPIGKFQAIQHRMAQLLVEIEQARSSVINATIYFDDETEREKTISAAKFSIGKIGTLVAEESIQLHGGMGMTWEYDLGHYAKRLVLIDHEFGDEDFHLQKYISL